jgi:hypothetical protein
MPGNPNTPEQVKARNQVLSAEARLSDAIAQGLVADAMDACKLTHHFTGYGDYGCSMYARELFIPKGTLLFGKIHRQEHLSFVMKGVIAVWTEHGPKLFEAPATLVSPPGVKRIGYAVEDTIWTTVHFTKYNNEGELDAIENEVIAPSYDAIGLLSQDDQEIVDHLIEFNP